MEPDTTSISDILLTEGNRPMLEGLVLQHSLNDQEFFRSISTLVCEDSAHHFERDFRIPEDNLLFRVLKCYWSVYGSAANRPPLTSVYGAVVSHLVERGSLQDGDVEPVRKRLIWISLRPRSDLEQYKGVLKQAVGVWIQDTRAAKLAQRAATNQINYTELAEAMSSLKSKVLGLTENRRMFSAGDSLDLVVPDVKRIPTPWASINKVIGGFGIGEADLVVAPRGAGKTVFGTQCASTAALMGYRTLFVTTEQPFTELEPRVVSQHANVDFAKILDGLRGNLQKCGPSEQDRAHALLAQIKNTLTWHDWVRGENVRDHLPAVIKRAQDLMGGLDFLVFDWIGKGIGAADTSDPGALRMLYRGAATSVADSAKDFNLSVLTFAQANVLQSFNKTLVDDTMVTEHKQIAEDMTRGFGLSCVRVGKDDSAVIADVQYLNIFKSRKAAGRALKITRDFSYQRFKDFEHPSKAGPR